MQQYMFVLFSFEAKSKKIIVSSPLMSIVLYSSVRASFEFQNMPENSSGFPV